LKKSGNNKEKVRENNELMELIKKVTNKRPRLVIEHILKHGQVTTEELKELYGYNHPPRAARDVREQGIPLKTVRVTGSDGRKIGAYQFDEISKVVSHKLGGRKVFSKKFKSLLVEKFGSKCTICNEKYEDRYLQIDHRVPYEVAGDFVSNEDHPEAFMLLCGSCNRSKSWSCEHCNNWLNDKNIDVCKQCYWGTPENYSHIALENIRRNEIIWRTDEEIERYNEIQQKATKKGITLEQYIKNVLMKSPCK